MGKIKREKGSALVMIIIMFVVLTIFSTFTLSFMVTENKQSINHEVKAKAYFVALSGAEIVENALIQQLESYKDDKVAQKAFLEVYATPQTIPVAVTGVKQVVVSYQPVDGQNVMSITSVGEVRGTEETIKKIIYSTESVVTSQDNGQLLLPDGQFLIYFTDGRGHESAQDTNLPLPSEVGLKVPDGKTVYPMHEFDSVDATLWTSQPSLIVNNRFVEVSYGEANKTTNLYVDGNLILDSAISFLGTVNVYVKGNLIINSGSQIIGEKKEYDDLFKNQLRIYVYNQNNETYGLSTQDKVTCNIVGDIFVAKGKVDFELGDPATIDGSIIYNGNEDLIFDTQSNSFNNKVLTGSIFALNATVRLGYDDEKHNWKTAFQIGGKVVADQIHVYANNGAQLRRFYTESSSNSNSLIPINTTKNITVRTISYKSFFND